MMMRYLLRNNNLNTSGLEKLGRLGRYSLLEKLLGESIRMLKWKKNENNQVLLLVCENFLIIKTSTWYTYSSLTYCKLVIIIVNI
jgi:hypothetical protein